MRNRIICKRLGAGYYCEVASGTGFKVVVYNADKHLDFATARSK